MNNLAKKGIISLQLLVFSSIILMLVISFSALTQSTLNSSFRSLNKTIAFSIAEAGIEYYRWHLAHNPTDYQDGTGNPGPYVHNYYDKNGNILGTFTLEITPPAVGSTVVTIKSTGKMLADSTVEKIIKVKMGIPSLAQYAWVLNNNVAFGSGAEVFGPVHSNAGLRFDGLAHNLVTSGQAQYDDPDHSGGNEFGVHTHRSPIDPLPPAAVPNRPDIFMAGRQFPVPAVDFGGITQNLSQIKTAAQQSGFYRASSTAFGYDVVLKTDDTFDLYKVTALFNASVGCSNPGDSFQNGWGTWSIQSESLLGNYAFPTNGLIFLEDHVWVRGQINTARVTIASGRFPDNASTRTSITVNNNLLYTNYDGRDVLGLIAQNNINVGLISDDNLRIDAALIAQNGRVGRYSYKVPCGPTAIRTNLTSYGMMGSNLRPAFYYSANNGYQSRVYNYDSYLLYSPPPSYPIIGNQYVQISWEEVK